MLPAVYSVVIRPYGLSGDAAGDIALPPLDASLTLAELYANQVACSTQCKTSRLPFLS